MIQYVHNLTARATVQGLAVRIATRSVNRPCTVDSVASVSYTHLDVYKRQVCQYDNDLYSKGY